jgi:hypothetical protein
MSRDTDEREHHERMAHLRGFGPLKIISTETHLMVGQTVIIEDVSYTLKRDRRGIFLEKNITRKREV